MSRIRVVAVSLLLVVGVLTGVGVPPAQADRSIARDVHPALRAHVVAAYDFDRPVPGDPALERDQGRCGTEIELINGGAAMRVPDRACRGSGNAVQARQVDPATAGNDDWKAGTWSASGVRTLRAFSATGGTTIMGWFKLNMDSPAPNSTTTDPDDSPPPSTSAPARWPSTATASRSTASTPAPTTRGSWRGPART
ncbi:hypothetical protein ACLQ24_18790 [Micromonospora sp. DT4]|uniref:hypothetical protein n=1 Tax=Micromonospora sp. DT4 TaxID=3393438 RepID=UPI003CED4447